MLHKVSKQADRIYFSTVFVLMTIVSAILNAEDKTVPEAENAAAQTPPVMLQRVVTPPPPGPYASRMGMRGPGARRDRSRVRRQMHVRPRPFPAYPVYPGDLQQESSPGIQAGREQPVYPQRPAMNMSPQAPAQAYTYRQNGAVDNQQRESVKDQQSTPRSNYPEWRSGYPAAPPRGYGYPPASYGYGYPSAPYGYGYRPVPQGYAPPGYGAEPQQLKPDNIEGSSSVESAMNQSVE